MANENSTRKAHTEDGTGNPFALVQETKRPAMIFVGAVMISVTLILLGGGIMDWFPEAPMWPTSVLSFLGYGVMAAPVMLLMIPGFGGFVDVGPCFTTVQSRVGDYIYEYTVRDYESQYTSNALLTFGKCILMFLISIIVTPIAAWICLRAYKRACNEAETYADGNGISRNEIPYMDRTMVKVTTTVFWIFLAIVLIVGLLTGENYAN